MYAKRIGLLQNELQMAKRQLAGLQEMILKYQGRLDELNHLMAIEKAEKEKIEKEKAEKKPKGKPKK